MVQGLLLDRARNSRNPFNQTDPVEAVRLVSSLEDTSDESWALVFGEAGEAHAVRGEFALAYGCYRVARYPAPNSAAKYPAYRRSQELYLRLAEAFDPPLERVRIPFRGRPGDGEAVAGYLRVPRTTLPPPPVVLWGGIDAFKEERRAEPYLARGLATLAIDMPGTGDAPIPGSGDAERMWDPIFAWLEGLAGVNGRRVAVVGGSTGGYWAAKLAHTHRDRIAAAVDHGGPVHHAFTREWIERSEQGEYPFALAETLASAFGRTTRDEWIAYAPRLSLLRQGILGRPCAPLLVVHGVGDSVFPIADPQLLLEHGDPKWARFFAGGHMGGPGADAMIADWVAARLA